MTRVWPPELLPRELVLEPGPGGGPVETTGIVLSVVWREGTVQGRWPPADYPATCWEPFGNPWNAWQFLGDFDPDNPKPARNFTGRFRGLSSGATFNAGVNGAYLGFLCDTETGQGTVTTGVLSPYTWCELADHLSPPILHHNQEPIGVVIGDFIIGERFIVE